MEIQEALALSQMPPREHIVTHEGYDYRLMLPAHDDGVYYTDLMRRRLEMGLISGTSGILAGSYSWSRVV